MKISIYSFALVLCFSGILCRKVPSKKELLSSLKEPVYSLENPLLYLESSDGDMVIEIFQDAAPRFISWINREKSELAKKQANGSSNLLLVSGIAIKRILPYFFIESNAWMNNTRQPSPLKINADVLGLDKIKVKDVASYSGLARQQAMHQLGLANQQEINQYRERFNRELDKILNMSVARFLSFQGIKFDRTVMSYKNEKYTVALNPKGLVLFNLSNNLQFDGRHQVFGRIIRGKTVAETISKSERNMATNAPQEKIKIDNIYLIE